jgi:KaiC/GvpD/RAD55 family RecA-like ATPase
MNMMNNAAINNTDGFEKFGKSFQEKLCKLIMFDRPFADQMEEVLDVSFFENKALQELTKLVFKHRREYNIHPSEETLETLVRTEIADLPESVQATIRNFVAKAIGSQVVADSDYIKNQALDFCKKQKLQEAILHSISLIKNSSFDEIKGVIDEALKLGMDNDFGHDFIKDFDARYVEKPRHPVTRGWALIDDLTQGGHGIGELGVVIAPTGAGKSMALTHLGAQAVKAGKTVVHYTLELADKVIAQRYDSCISEIKLNELKNRKEDVLDSIKEVEGALIVKEYPTKSASIATLDRHLEKLASRGIKIGTIIVDYADLLKSVTSYKDKRFELESIYEELRGLAQKYSCPIWTASQTNRSGVNAEIVTMEAISEAFNKCFVADFICSLSRTIEDRNNNTGRLYVAKNRNGADGLVFPLFMDTSNVKIRVLEPTNESIEDLKKNTAKRQMNHLREQYKQMKNEEGE